MSSTTTARCSTPHDRSLQLEELQILSHASLMPTSKLGLPAVGPVSAQDGASDRGTVLLHQALPQLLDLLSQPLYQWESRGLHHLPLEVLHNTNTLLYTHALMGHTNTRSGKVLYSSRTGLPLWTHWNIKFSTPNKTCRWHKNVIISEEIKSKTQN